MAFQSGMKQYFGDFEWGTEARAGLATFLTMSYILFVNPSILGNAITVEGVDMFPQLMAATAIAAAFGCLIMGLFGRYPFALAPGMGLNAYFTYTVVLGAGVAWQTALGAVFISGILFLIISLVGLREILLNAIPTSLKLAITAGIGCFLATIGFINAGLVVDHPVTLISMGSLKSPGVLIALLGLFLTLVLLVFKVRGAILYGILGASVVAVLSGAPVFQGQPFAGFHNGIVKAPVWPSDLFMAMDLTAAMGLGALSIVFTFLFVDFFDTAGTLIALSRKAGVLDEQDRLPRARAAFSADALATSVGAILGTSSTTSYIESASGIQEGGKTGLTAVFVALLFLVSLFFWPLAGAVPAAAAASALIIVGAMMMFTTSQIHWEDFTQSVPALLTILGMPLTFSITDGISLGLISYCLIHLFTGRFKQVHWLMYLLTALLIWRYLWLGNG